MTASVKRRASTALPALALGALCACKASDARSAIVISEFLAANASGLTDIDRDTSDWIELHNRSNTAVNLEGWRLTDNPQDPERWRLPAVLIPAGGYMLVFASGKNLTSVPTQLHTSFKLKATADYLALLHPGGSVAHEFAPYPNQRTDVSFGLTSAGTHDYLSQPTPAAPNDEGKPPAQ